MPSKPLTQGSLLGLRPGQLGWDLWITERRKWLKTSSQATQYWSSGLSNAHSLSLMMALVMTRILDPSDLVGKAAPIILGKKWSCYIHIRAYRAVYDRLEQTQWNIECRCYQGSNCRWYLTRSMHGMNLKGPVNLELSLLDGSLSLRSFVDRHTFCPGRRSGIGCRCRSVISDCLVLFSGGCRLFPRYDHSVWTSQQLLANQCFGLLWEFEGAGCLKHIERGPFAKKSASVSFGHILTMPGHVERRHRTATGTFSLCLIKSLCLGIFLNSVPLHKVNWGSLSVTLSSRIP